MASISKEPNGRRSLQFVAGDGKRRTIRIGKVSKKIAEGIKRRVEELNAANIADHPIDRDTASWLSQIDDSLAEKLARAGLIPKRESVQLSEYLADYIKSRTDAKPNTVRKWRTTQQKLIDHFGAETPLGAISEGAVDEWRRKLSKGRAENTIRKHIGVAKLFFNAAVRQGLLSCNPFADQKASILPNDSRFHFVTREDSTKVIQACPDAQWKLIFVLCRYGGLRCPSEVLRLRWGDIDWEGRRFQVKASKTERHVGKGHRFVPIFPELTNYLQAVLQELLEDFDPKVHRLSEQPVITRYRDTNSNLRTQLKRIITKAGLHPWEKPFQNLRSTRQTELEAEFPLHVVCSWLGNSEKVARRHYLQVTDEHFAKAVGDKVLHNPVQHAAELGCTAPHTAPTKDENSEEDDTSSVLTSLQVAEAGLEPARGLPPTGF